MGKKGFTLLEITVVLVIVGILASIGIAQYHKVVRESYFGEAKTNLSMLRKLMIAYKDEYGSYPANVTQEYNPLGVDLALWGNGRASDACADANFFFQYDCWGDVEVGGTAQIPRCIAFRCESGGKNPQAPDLNERLVLFIENGTLRKWSNGTSYDMY